MSDVPVDDQRLYHRAAFAETVLRAIDDLPLVAQLGFVKNILCDRGGSREDGDADAVLIVATEVIEHAMHFLQHKSVGDNFLREGGHVVDRVTRDTVEAFNYLPLLPRLQFAKNLILRRGKTWHDHKGDEMFEIATKAMDNIIAFVRNDQALATLQPRQ